MFLFVSALIYLTISLIVIAAIDVMVGRLYLPVAPKSAPPFKPTPILRAATARIVSKV